MKTQQQQIREAQQRIKRVLSADKDTSKGQVKEEILPISEKEARFLSKITKLSITSEYKHVLDKSGLGHAFKKHGSERESLRGQRQLTLKDILKIPEIIINFDKIKIPFDLDGNQEKSSVGNVLIQYEKTFDDGTTYYVEEVRVGKKELALATIWIKEKGKALKAFPLLENEQMPSV